MGGTISGMTKRSITGRPEISAIMREVWADQIDNYGDDCPICQLEGRRIECNVYVPMVYSEMAFIGCCLCCSMPAVHEVAGYNVDHDVIIEFSGGDRK